MKRSKLIELRELIERAAASLADDDALEAVELFPAWQSGATYTVKSEGGVLIKPRVVYNDKLYRVEQTHTSQVDWTPDITPALYTEVTPPGEIGVWKQPTGSQDAYPYGARVYYPNKGDAIWASKVANNVWEPGVYGWELEGGE